MCGLYQICTQRKYGRKHGRKKIHVTLTNAESGSSNSTSSDNENSSLSDEGMNMKMPAVARKKSSLTEQESDTVQIDIPGDSVGLSVCICCSSFTVLHMLLLRQLSA